MSRGRNGAGEWTVVGLLSLGVVIAYLDRTNISIALGTEAFRAAFGATDVQRGIVNSAFFWTYAIFQVPAGMLVDRFSAVKSYAICFAIWSLLSAATASVTTVGALIALRLLLGVAEAVVTPASLRWINTNVAERRRGLAIGIYQAGTKIGSAVGAPVTAWLILAFGWRKMFLIMGAAGALWLVPWLLIAHDGDPSQRPRPSDTGPSLTDLLKRREIWGVVLGTFCYGYFGYFCVTWLPAYLMERQKLSLNAMGLYTFLSFAGIAVMTPLAGWWADRSIARGGDPIRVRKRFIVAGFLLASTEVLGVLSESQSAALFFAIFSLTALGLAGANYWALTQTLVPASAAGRAGGLQSCASSLAGALSPLITGWLKQTTGGYRAPMQLIVLVLIAGVAVYLVLIPRSLAEARR